MINCPYCRRDVPDYFVPRCGARVPVICYECHIEQQDVRNPSIHRVKQGLGIR